MRWIYLLLYRLLYNELAWAYDVVSWAVSLGRWDSWRRAALPFICGNRILEVGFGTGDLLPVLADGQRRVIGIEPSAAMQRITLQKLSEQTETIPRIQGTAQSLPFADKVPSIRLSALSLHPISLTRVPIRSLRAVCRPGGRIVDRGGYPS